MRIATIEQEGDVYVARDAGDEVVWSVELHLDMSGSPFREQIVWPDAFAVVIAGGNAVHFLCADSGKPMQTLSLGDDLFGHIGPTGARARAPSAMRTSY